MIAKPNTIQECNETFLGKRFAKKIVFGENFKVKQIPAILRRGKPALQSIPSFAFAHKIKAFSRFECFEEMLLFAEVGAPEEAIIDALRHFCWRFPTFVVSLYKKPFLWSGTQRKGVSIPLQRGFESKQEALKWVRKTVQKQVNERWSTSVEWKKEFYDVFFDSQFILSRKNRVLQTRLMPPFFVQKGSVEYSSIREARYTKPNTNLAQFE